MFRTIAPAALLVTVLAAPALAQSSVSPSHKYVWNENCGWLNWRDAGSPVASQGVRVAATYLAGYAWAENIGWINLGDGTPANGSTYANATGADFGVNLDTAGLLSGMAWGENAGWINFAGGRLAGGDAMAATLDRAAQRFRGFAWGENIGWINLNDATHFVGIGCPADLDDGTGTGTPDGGVTIEDLLYYLGQYAQGTTPADLDDGTGTGTPDGGVTIDDLLYFLARYAAGC